jgi:hypothetical protein
MLIRALFFVFLIIPFATKAQPSLRELQSARSREADRLVEKAKEVAFAKELPYEWIDEHTGRVFLLVVDEQGNWSYRASLNEGAAITTGAAVLQSSSSGFNLTGKGMVCALWDDGIVKSHIELAGRLLSTEGPSEQTHATHVAGTILSAGINPSAKGMAPHAKAYTYYFDNDLAEMSSLASEDDKGLLLSNHSYGTVTGWARRNGVWNWEGDPAISPDEDYRHGFYGNKAKSLDQLAYLAPYYTIVWAAGNDRAEVGDGSRPADCNKGTGYDCIIPDAVAKNIITVGAVNKVLSYISPSSVVMSNFSSWGPTDDGRIKPDVVGAGVGIFSLSAVNTGSYTSSNGTSMATPNVTGSLLLLQELHGKLNAGKKMKAATLKALAIHTAREAGAKPGPDYQFGWGLLNVEAAANTLLYSNNFDARVIESTLKSGESFQFDISPLANKKITLTICWTDPEGNPVAPVLDPQTRMLVNDLDIRLIDETGLVTLPWILNPTAPQAQATQGDNDRDNVEKIELEAPFQKKYTVLVRHKGALKFGSQDFSLILTYTPVQNDSKTLYWVGGSGQWHDAAKWSLSQGGPSAGLIPGEKDRVIFDASSLQENDAVQLTQQAACERLTWLNDQQTSLNTNGHSLTIKNELIIGTDKLTITGGGSIRLNTPGSGNVSVLGADGSAVDMVFESGEWNLRGEIKSKRVTLLSGKHSWASTKVAADEINVNAVTVWDISDSDIETRKLTLPSSSFLFPSDNAMITSRSSASEMDWKAHNFSGRINVKSSAILSLNGSGNFRSIELEGAISINENASIDTLLLNPASILKIANNKMVQIKKNIDIASTPSQKVTIEAITKANLSIDYHQKICADHLILKNVDIGGNAIVNAGVNSSLQNALHWLQLVCDDVLFPDFEVFNNCAGGMTRFIDKSTGAVTNWSWSFITESGMATSNNRHAEFTFTNEKDYEVILTISNTGQEASVRKIVPVKENLVQPNSVVEFSTDQLISVSLAESYQWYVNKVAIEGSTNRTLLVNNTPGVYEVVTSQGNCNRISAPYVITGFEYYHREIKLFPNPASDYLTVDIQGVTNREAELLNCLGQFIQKIDVTKPVPVHHLSSGIYFLRFFKGDQTTQTSKVIISR